MTFAHAGRYLGTVADLNGRPITNASVQINVPGTSTAATLYANADRATGTNPVSTDAEGTLSFWAESGDYDVVYNGVADPVRVMPDPRDISAALDGIAALQTAIGDPVQLQATLASVAALRRARTANIFYPEDYGAVRDGVTDDTAALRACVAAAYAAGLADGSYYAEVRLHTGVYLLSGAPQQGGATKGNAQIPLPVHAFADQKFTLALKGTVDASAHWHWQQTTPQRGGAVLKSTWAGSNDGVFGPCAMLAGPSAPQGYGTGTDGGGTLFSNMLVYLDGITFVVPNDPHISAVDLQGVACAHIPSLTVLADATPSTRTDATQVWTVGLRMPANNNNDFSWVGSLHCEGINFAFVPDEHTIADYVVAVYCVAAVEPGNGSNGMSHGCLLRYVSAEVCQVAVGAFNAHWPTKIDIEMLDCEGTTGMVVNDPDSVLFGTIKYNGIGTTHIPDPTATSPYGVRGGAQLRVYDMTRQPGWNAPPAVPASGTPMMNPFYRDLDVVLSGGTVSAVVLDGVNIGTTSGPFVWRTGSVLTLTYSAAPTLHTRVT